VTTTRDLLVSLLRGAGVERVVGERPLGDLAHIRCDDPDLACLLADADGRVNGGFGAALLAGPILHLSSRIGGTAPLQTIGSAEDLVEALAPLDPGGPPATFALHLDLDLDEPLAGAPSRPEPSRGVVVTLDPELRHLRLAVVVGPGVVRAGAAGELLSMATAMGVSVVNTFGAKGVFRWDSPFHGGTAGLQARDWELAGVLDADLVLLSGLGPDEVPPEVFRDLVVQDVDPSQLGSLALRWPNPDGTPERPPLYDVIAAVVQPLYEDTGVPLSAARASLHLSGACPDGGVVVADADLAGFWIGRTFPTGIPGSVVVSPVPIEGASVAGALMAGAAGRPAVAVTANVGEVTDQLLEVAEAIGERVAVQVWEDGGAAISADRHVALTQEQFAGSQPGLAGVTVGMDPSSLEAVAGPVDPRFAY
jgi:hypothetical protein